MITPKIKEHLSGMQAWTVFDLAKLLPGGETVAEKMAIRLVVELFSSGQIQELPTGPGGMRYFQFKKAAAA